MTGLFIGLNTIDLHFLISESPGPNSKHKAQRYEIYAGGPSTNAAIAFSRLGGMPCLLTGIGDHHFTGFIKEDLSNQGVAVIDFMDNIPSNPTFASIITTEINGDRTIFSYHPETSSEIFRWRENIKNQSFKCILTDGFHSEIGLSILPWFKGKVPIILDGGSWKPNMEKLLPFVDVAICSENFMPPDCEDENDVIQILKKFDIHKIAITRGNRSILVWENKSHYSIEVRELKAIDTLGAGDFFHGAFAWYYGKGYSFKDSLKLASGVASESCLYFGTREWLKKSTIF